jgi:hypothetical protein
MGGAQGEERAETSYGALADHVGTCPLGYDGHELRLNLSCVTPCHKPFTQNTCFVHV